MLKFRGFLPIVVLNPIRIGVSVNVVIVVVLCADDNVSVVILCVDDKIFVVEDLIVVVLIIEDEYLFDIVGLPKNNGIFKYYTI